MRSLRPALASLALSAPLLAPMAIGPAAATAVPGLTVDGAALDGAAVAGQQDITAAAAGAVSVKWVVDGTYRGKDTTAPYTLAVDLPVGAHRVKARAETPAGTVQLEADFTVVAEASVVQSSVPAPAPVPAPTAPVGTTLVKVSTAAALTEALATVAPGTMIELADGVYRGRFVGRAQGTADAPVVLRGGRGAVLDGGSTSSGYVLHLNGARHWRLEGFTVRGGQKGVVLDRTSSVVMSGLDVGHTGQEAVHFRSGSSDNRLQDSLVHDTGLQTPGYGEGVYIGSAKSNWSTYSGGQPDRSDRNVVIGNRIWATTAESIDVKEGTSDGILEGNVMDGASLSGENYADSLVDVKGNGYRVLRNHGTGPVTDAFQTHVVLDGWGSGTLFAGNRLDVRATGYGIWVHRPGDSATVVGCDNAAPSAAKGLSNIACR